MKSFDTRKSIRRYQIAGFISMFLVVGVVGGWSAMAAINGAVIAPAVITVESYTKKIQHKEGGIVAQIKVKDGDVVKQGQDLVVLDDTETKAELGVVDAVLLELVTKRARLEAQRDASDTIEYPLDILNRKEEPEVAHIIKGQQKLFDSRRAAIKGKKEQLSQQIGQINEQIEGIKAQQTSKVSQLKLIESELAGLRKLQKQGLVPVTRVLAMEREMARLEGERGSFVADKAQAESKIGEIKILMIQVDEEDRSQVLTDLRDAESRIAELTERQLAAKSKLTRTSMKSPINGTVYQVMVHTIGGVIGPGEPIMLIVPEGDDFVLEAQVSPADIDQVHENQRATVRFSSLANRLTPEMNGTVIQVSADTSRTDTNSPPFYSVRIKLNDGEDVKLMGQKLKPGMPAEAFIQTDQRTVLSYFVKPLMDQVAHTFREN
jgi:HlyD family secretion protein